MTRTPTTDLLKGLPELPPAFFSRSGSALRVAMRKLWADHVVWTRDYVVNAVAGSQSADESAQRLLRNQEEIGKAIVPYYGKDAGDKLTTLLKEHISIAVDLVAAAKAGDQRKLQDADQRWTRNANDIAEFLANANPHWPQAQVADLLSLHLELTKNEATARLEKRWADDTRAFDDIFNEIMTLADALAAGIVQQFPDKFAR